MHLDSRPPRSHYPHLVPGLGSLCIRECLTRTCRSAFHLDYQKSGVLRSLFMALIFILMINYILRPTQEQIQSQPSSLLYEAFPSGNDEGNTVLENNNQNEIDGILGTSYQPHVRLITETSISNGNWFLFVVLENLVS